MSQLKTSKQDGGKDHKTKSKGKKEHPVHEKMNSSQRRKGNAPKSDGVGGHYGGSKDGRLFNFQQAYDRFKSVHSRKLQLDKRRVASKLPCWDHLNRVPRGTINGQPLADEKGVVRKRFTSFSEFKDKKLGVTQTVPVFKCDHIWVKEKKVIGVGDVHSPPNIIIHTYCRKCDEVPSVHDEKDGFVMLTETQTGDLNDNYEFVCQEFEAARSMIRDGLGNKPFLFKLVYDQGGANSSPATALSYVQRVRPSDDNVDFAFAQAIFDEYKMTHGEYIWFVNRSASGNASAVPAAAVAYDPIDVVSVNKVPNILRYAQHQGPVQMNEAGTTPQQTNPTGFYHFHFKCPSGPQYEYGAVTSIGTGVWTDTQQTAVDYGYIKTAIPSLGGAVVTTVQAYLTMMTEFRCTV